MVQSYFSVIAFVLPYFRKYHPDTDFGQLDDEIDIIRKRTIIELYEV